MKEQEKKFFEFFRDKPEVARFINQMLDYYIEGNRRALEPLNENLSEINFIQGRIDALKYLKKLTEPYKVGKGD